MKRASHDELRLRANDFVSKWQHEPGRERQQDQTFVRELLMVFGVSETRAALYQHESTRASTGGRGYIDALLPGIVAIEVKTAGEDLEAAEMQALDYLHALSDAEFPKYVLTSDFKRFRLLDLAAPDGRETLEFDLLELPKYVEALEFLSGHTTRSFGSFQQEEASVKAAQIMGKLYESLDGSGYGEHESSVFLVRTLFCLYADDSGIWRRGQFLDFLEKRTYEDGSDLGSQLSLLFQVLSRPMDSRQAKLPTDVLDFPYVNGEIFEEQLRIPVFDKQMRDELIRACHFNWSSISPAIFGSLFQAVKSTEARRALGAHYTTETNIRKVIGPTFLDELESEFKLSFNDLSRLRTLRSKIGSIKILDPACGCGNFLVVSFASLRDLELRILVRLGELGDGDVRSTLFFGRDTFMTKLSQLHGIELEEWPARIAQVALFLTEHQANVKAEHLLGKSPELLPLTKLSGVQIANALLIDWTTVMDPGGNAVIVGNPPFVGHQQKTPAQVSDLKSVWGADYDGYLDYVTGWFKKAADFFNESPSGRFSFVATNSISQGQPVGALFKPLLRMGWSIRFAHQSFSWSSEAPGSASVHCVIVGMDKSRESNKTLYVYPDPKSPPIETPVSRINSLLIEGDELFVKKRSKPINTDLPPVSFGTMPLDNGHLIVDEEEYDLFFADEIARKYLRRLVGSAELVRGEKRWCLWLEDASPSDIRKSNLISQRVKACKEWRTQQKVTGDAYKFRETPHLFRPNASRPSGHFACFPRVVSENRNFFTVDYLGPDFIGTDAVFTCEDPTGFAFAIASSSMFMAWQKLVGGRLESRLRFSSTGVWNNFPLPSIGEETKERLISAGKEILRARSAKGSMSLADLYHPLAMSRELLFAHKALDSILDQIFEDSVGEEFTLGNDGRSRILTKAYNALSDIH